MTDPGVEPGVREALPTAGGVGRSVHRELVLPLHGVDEVVGGVPGGCSNLHVGTTYMYTLVASSHSQIPFQDFFHLCITPIHPTTDYVVAIWLQFIKHPVSV